MTMWAVQIGDPVGQPKVIAIPGDLQRVGELSVKWRA